MKTRYQSPLSSRYASDEMQYIFSEEKKFKTWRRLWIALAKAERELGLPISKEQIDELVAHAEDINYEVAAKREKEVRHDVMAHVYAYGVLCPLAKPIIHLGATSCYVGDNTDIILMKEGLLLLKNKLINVIFQLSNFAKQYADMPTLGFTHFQPAQLTTVGKRACLWINELMQDYEDLNHMLGQLKLLGSKGTTGTQASFMELFENDEQKVKKLEQFIANEMGFSQWEYVSGQTYSRKVDARVLNVLSGIAQSAYKFSNDMRLLQHLKEMEEPFEKHQIGSSAMPYKRNPMRSERIGALARYVIVDTLNPAITASTQWFERTLDDSANKRIAVSEAFLAVDAILNIYLDISRGMVVYEKMIHQHILNELPFMISENIMMNAVKKGGDRQELHEKLRLHSIEAGKTVKEQGKPNDLVERIVSDPAFGLSKEEISAMLNPSDYTGRAKSQTFEYINEVVSPILEQHKDCLGLNVALKV